VTVEDLDNRFSYHKPDENKAATHEKIRGLFRQVAGYLNDALPEGREKSLAITHIEEVMFWSNAAIARSE